jgi:TolA-binding protein
VKLGEGRRRRRDYNPVERAPLIPSSISLKEPDQEALDRLDAAAVDPGIRAELDADHSFAQAVAKLNRGDLQSAEQELLAFAGEHPRHTAADNALYLAGLIREHNGDCAGAVALFERVPLTYPAGDAVLSSLVEKARCLSRMERKDEARELLARIVREHPQGVEGGAARQLLMGLDIESGRH